MLLYHDLFGNGQITDIDGEIVTIRFDSSGIKKLSIKICKQKDLLKVL